MDSYNSMKSKLNSIGLYNISEQSCISRELKAYACELDRLCSELDVMYRECFIETAQTYGLALRESLAGREKSDQELEKRREILKLQQQMMGGECTLSSFKRFLKSCGLNDFEIAEDCSAYKITVTINDALTDEQKAEAEEKIAAEIPAHITLLVNYSE